MTFANTDDPGTMIGASVHGPDGTKLGKIESIYLDDETNRPEWAAVSTGMFGGHVSLVPLRQGQWGDDTLRVPFDKEQLKNAPHHDPAARISVSEEHELCRHYGIDHGRTGDDRAQGHVPGDTGDTGTEVAGGGLPDRTSGGADPAMTRSEERLRVGTETHEVGKARLRKHIVTENVSTTVPVRREEVVVEREPITEANRDQAMAGDDLTEDEHEVVLHEEQVVTAKDTVPVERVRLGTETVTEHEQVDETVRKEHIDLPETDVDPGQR